MEKEIIVVYCPEDISPDKASMDAMKADGFIVLTVTDPRRKRIYIDVHYRDRVQTQILTKFNPNIFSCAEERPTK
jgi:hypothetical protein